VFTNGCFDVLHRGHVAYLKQARQAGDVLIVAINSDRSVRRLKGWTRPINNEIDRAAVLGELGCVDYVTVFDDDTPASLIQRLQPDIYVKGGDYTAEMLPETPVVRSYGGEVRMLGYVANHSTTETIARIRSSADC
jgi:rfaE bifunctional protein nucleotidyltransferase chain/domain